MASRNPLSSVVVPTDFSSGSQLALERAKDGANGVNNWTFPRKDDKQSGWRSAVVDLIITLGNIRLVDLRQRADVRLRVDALSAQEAGRARCSVRRWLDGGFTNL